MDKTTYFKISRFDLYISLEKGFMLTRWKLVLSVFLNKPTKFFDIGKLFVSCVTWMNDVNMAFKTCLILFHIRWFFYSGYVGGGIFFIYKYKLFAKRIPSLFIFLPTDQLNKKYDYTISSQEIFCIMIQAYSSFRTF